MLSAQRYVAYTSDIGESFRPVAHPYLIKTAYGVSIAYLIGDVANEGRKAWVRQNALMHPSNPGIVSRRATDASVVRDKNTEALIPAVPKAVHVPAINDWKAVMAQRAVFQALASMILPAFTIHSIVRYSGQAFKNVKSPKIRTWGPVGVSSM
jgi:fission process protein 1